MYQRILVPVDNSQTSKDALLEAARLIQNGKDAVLRMIHVIDLTQFSWSANAPVDTANLQQELKQSGQALLDTLHTEIEIGQASLETGVVEAWGGAFAKGILEEAARWNADLIVMGTHGHSGVTHLLLGSVAEGVVRGSTVPVLLVRTPKKGSNSLLEK